jgi:hypothetical protein
LSIDSIQPQSIKVLIADQKNVIPVIKTGPVQSVPETPVAIQSREEQLFNHLHNNIINSRVWPNPFKNLLSVEYNLQTEDETEIRLLSIDGKLMGILTKEKRPAGLQTQQFEVAVPAGTYILQILSNNMKASHKLIKQ